MSIALCVRSYLWHAQRQYLQKTRSASRDIVLCLDVSGSALSYDRQIIAAYSQIARNLNGERIGLSTFNSTSKTVFL